MKVLDFILNMLNDIFENDEFDENSTFQKIIDGGIEELSLIHFLYAIELEYKVTIPDSLTDDLGMTLKTFAKNVENLSPSQDPMFRYHLLKTISDEIAACYFDEEDEYLEE
ncbi:MAG: hypothetical protein PHE86_07555 [Candidatus Marinimicrobia bacterium]|nr:hypothetical protein [Candidatus Neomarinimicrobiota bacterium]MDD5582353.1 hypothetical protein [Candidatus Neomarinimicrobiota bacterium]